MTWRDGVIDCGMVVTANISQSVVGDLARPPAVNDHVVTAQVSVVLDARLVQVSHAL